MKLTEKQTLEEFEKEFEEKYIVTYGDRGVLIHRVGDYPHFERAKPLVSFLYESMQKAREEERAYMGKLKREWYSKGFEEGKKETADE